VLFVVAMRRRSKHSAGKSLKQHRQDRIETCKAEELQVKSKV
jgi:hypothetical protein